MLITRNGLLQLIGALTTRPAAALLGAPSLGLFTNDINPGLDALLTDFVRPGAPYADKALTVSGPFTDPAGNVFIHFTDLEFASADLPAPPLTVYGAFIHSGMDPWPQIVGRFRQPLVYNRTSDVLIVSGDLVFLAGADQGPWLTEP